MCIEVDIVDIYLIQNKTEKKLFLTNGKINLSLLIKACCSTDECKDLMYLQLSFSFQLEVNSL